MKLFGNRLFQTLWYKRQLWAGIDLANLVQLWCKLQNTFGLFTREGTLPVLIEPYFILNRANYKTMPFCSFFLLLEKWYEKFLFWNIKKTCVRLVLLLNSNQHLKYQSVLGVDFSDFFANRQFHAGVNCGQVLILLILSNFSANCKTLVDFLLKYRTISVSFLIRNIASMFLFLPALITYVSSFWSFWHSFFWTLLLSVTDSSINNLILFLEWTWSPRLSVPSVGTSGNFLAKVVAHGLRHFSFAILSSNIFSSLSLLLIYQSMNLVLIQILSSKTW